MGAPPGLLPPRDARGRNDGFRDGWRAGWDWRRGQGVTGGARGEAEFDAAQPRPDQDDERAGEAIQANPPSDGLAQALDDESEAVGRGESGGWVHEQK
jgi:hypothetical protein